MHYEKVVDFCEDGETTIARDGVIAILGVFYITYDGQEEIVEENDVPQILLQARPAFRHPVYWAGREELLTAQKSQGFFGPRRGAGGREQRPRMKRSSIQQLMLRTRCARCRMSWRESRTTQQGRYDRSAWRTEEISKGFIAVGSHGAETFLPWAIMDIRRS